MRGDPHYGPKLCYNVLPLTDEITAAENAASVDEQNSQIDEEVDAQIDADQEDEEEEDEEEEVPVEENTFKAGLELDFDFDFNFDVKIEKDGVITSRQPESIPVLQNALFLKDVTNATHQVEANYASLSITNVAYEAVPFALAGYIIFRLICCRNLF